RGGEMPRLALVLRKRVVCDLLHQRLEKAVMAALGRARVAFEPEDLLADERCEQRRDLVRISTAERSEAFLGEGLAEHRCVAENPALVRLEPVEPSSDQRVQRLRDLEDVDLPDRPVLVADPLEQTAVEQ